MYEMSRVRGSDACGGAVRACDELRGKMWERSSVWDEQSARKRFMW